ncbi:hypothetical protein [Clostridium sp. ZS2-4]|uniref:hypothetical protein n=1 Tax=Clostridium sp. ZS2-4 TaxID=2987703 RepID=UPI00227D5E62|nr:hypothetical protein [Clostridium sp. ZS2-4]MCY6354932.1 hypothetical protein [Clostridium sp. ZS2-4]
MKGLNLMVLAFICESIWETIKMAIPHKLPNWGDRIGVMAIGIVLSIASRMDLMSIIGIPLNIPGLGMIFTGLLISRGSNFMHDILATVNNMQQNIKNQEK